MVLIHGGGTASYVFSKLVVLSKDDGTRHAKLSGKCVSEQKQFSDEGEMRTVNYERDQSVGLSELVYLRIMHILLWAAWIDPIRTNFCCEYMQL